MEKIAIVTGAGRGIGAATANFLAAEGISVGVLDVNLENAQRISNNILNSGGNSIAIKCDVGNVEHVENAIKTIENEFGVPTILVNNAGVGGPFHRIDQVTDEEWEWIMNTNLKSIFYFCRRLLPKMKNLEFGRIINVASIQGLLGSAHSSTYVASKHAMVGYTKTIAAEWGQYGITANAICPGYVDTALGVQTDKINDYMDRVLQKSPVKRVAMPEEVASLIVHLVGPHSGYINGASYTIDGGISAHVGITSDI
ncbi:SDR family NAD(P)-dependent oxidoreductase [Brevibacillus choshinensis]|uniref:SDR family oxidoreductase n=1 Tax=Brevibacillus choshinensis TaxID=54911 RepID=A0ABX7FTB8_BRECH|nr:SDR family NAD(P)-dependent oxidoreductase [Brevibacillus choshinensis]QRG69478.1 SDR family oxidoreductase [Brevibacillus choshinensis]